MMEMLEDAPEPFFGTMSVDPRLPSPFDIPQVGLIPLEPTRNHEMTVEDVKHPCQAELSGWDPATGFRNRPWNKQTSKAPDLAYLGTT